MSKLSTRWLSGTCLVLFLCLGGCDSYSEMNVTDNPNLWGGYANHAVFKLKTDVFLLQLDDKVKGVRLALSPEGKFELPSRYYSVPVSVAEYQAAKEKEVQRTEIVHGRAYNVPTETVDVVESGTRVQCVKLVQFLIRSAFFGEEHGTIVFAKIMDGKHEGTVVDITDLSQGRKTAHGLLTLKTFTPLSSILEPLPIVDAEANKKEI